jgi:flagellar basal-body rod protein FlgC
MSLFSAIGTAGSGIDAMQTWIDASGANVANAEDQAPTSQGVYAEQTAEFAPVSSGLPGSPGGGVTVSVAVGSSAGMIESDPESPLADSKGDIRVSSVDLGNQLVQLIQAQDGYQADSDVISRATQAYQSGLTIGT